MNAKFRRLKTISERVEFILTERGLGVREAARITGIDQASISRIKNGSTPNPGAQTLLTLCNGLGITLSEFFEGIK